MRKNDFYLSYFVNTKCIWFLLLLSIYGVFACEFESLRMSIFSINCDITTINKINNIIENLSFSYIAGVVLFLLADTITFLRRKKIVCRNVERSLSSIISLIDDFSQFVNGKNWGNDTDAKIVFEEYSGGIYSENMPSIKVQPPMRTSMNTLTEKLNTYVDFIISQELYLGTKMLDDMEKILNKMALYVTINNEWQEDEMSVEAIRLVNFFDDIIQVKKTIKKYI